MLISVECIASSEYMVAVMVMIVKAFYSEDQGLLRLLQLGKVHQGGSLLTRSDSFWKILITYDRCTSTIVLLGFN